MLSYHPTYEAFCLQGSINYNLVMILNDGESTHNFLQTRVVKLLGLSSQTNRALWVMVGDGFIINCLNRCSNIPPSIQGHHFVVDLHDLPISGACVVLDVQCLKELGSIVIDYRAHTMSFIRDGTLVELHSPLLTIIGYFSPTS